MTLRSPDTRRLMPWLAAGHGCVDIYQGAVAALVPFLVAERAYTYAAASGVVLAASLLSSVVQPVFGALTDKWSMGWLIPVSTLAAGIGLAAAGAGDSYVTTLVAVAVSGIGVAAYHPEAARLAWATSRGDHTAMGWFALGGNVGFLAAPVLVYCVVSVGGLRASPLLAMPGLVGAALYVVAARRSTVASTGSDRADTAVAENDWKSFARLSSAIVCRSIVFMCLSAFVSLYVSQRTGGGTLAGTTALVVLYAGGAVGTVVGGKLAGRFGRIRVMRWSYALTGPAVAGILFAPAPMIYPFVVLASAGLYVPFSLHISLGQDYLPRRMGTASGVTLGLAVSIGSIASPFVGAVADTTSLRVALLPLIALPVLGTLLLGGLREPDVAAARDQSGRR